MRKPGKRFGTFSCVAQEQGNCCLSLLQLSQRRPGLEICFSHLGLGLEILGYGYVCPKIGNSFGITT